MRRDKRKKSESIGLDFKKVLYISGSILAIAAIGFVITFFAYGNKIEKEAKLSKLDTSVLDNTTGNTEEASSQFGKTVNELEDTNSIQGNVTDSNSIDEDSTNTTKYAVNTSAVESQINKEKSNTTSDDTNKNTTSEEKQKIKDPEFKMPVSGEIVKEYAKEKLVYSNTLGEWVIHNGIDIKAEKTTVVKASADGTVKSIKNDPRYGLTVVIEHVNGFTSVYSNLLTAEFVVVGENIKEGQTIGTVGNTATFEISDEPHLHFEILKDGEYLDPELYIKK